MVHVSSPNGFSGLISRENWWKQLQLLSLSLCLCRCSWWNVMLRVHQNNKWSMVNVLKLFCLFFLLLLFFRNYLKHFTQNSTVLHTLQFHCFIDFVVPYNTNVCHWFSPVFFLFILTDAANYKTQLNRLYSIFKYIYRVIFICLIRYGKIYRIVCTCFNEKSMHQLDKCI